MVANLRSLLQEAYGDGSTIELFLLLEADSSGKPGNSTSDNSDVVRHLFSWRKPRGAVPSQPSENSFFFKEDVFEHQNIIK